MEAARISAQEAHRLYEHGRVTFIDARNPQAWGSADDKLPGAWRLTPHASVEELLALPKDRTLIAYCT